MIPLAGAPVTELFGLIMTPPAARRQRAWMESIGEGLRAIEGRIGGLEQLQSNEAFIDTATQATYAAMRNSQREKLDALRAAVLNSALPDPPEDSLQLFFLALVDQLTSWHLRVLRLFDDPPGWFTERDRTFPEISIAGGSRSEILLAAYPELGAKRAFYDQIVRDLFGRGLLGNDSVHASINKHGAAQRLTTELARQFLRFITEPTANH
jgi:hypothetical protein